MIESTRPVGLIRGVLSTALSLTVAPVGLFGLVVAVLLCDCGMFSPSDAAVRTADRFYDAMSRGDFETAIQMCGRRMLDKTPPRALQNQFQERHDRLGSLVARPSLGVHNRSSRRESPWDDDKVSVRV